MLSVLNRRGPEAPPAALVEVVTPRTNTATLTAAENLLAAITSRDTFSLEIAATSEQRWFLARAAHAPARAQLESQLAVAYPQADLRPLAVARFPGLDPAVCGPYEQVALTTLVLREAECLPLRTFRDAELGDGSGGRPNTQADPILGILGALGALPEGWRALAQLVLRPAPDNWSVDYLRFALENPLAEERAARASAGSSEASSGPVIALALLLVLGAIGLQCYKWYRHGDWLYLGALALGLFVGAPALLTLIYRLRARRLYDPRLVEEKISRPAYLTQLRLAVFAPANVPPAAVEAQLDRLAAAYRPFSHGAGNGFVARSPGRGPHELRALAFLPGPRVTLNTRELAGLWHLPQASADVSFLERTAARQRLPLSITVSRGCRIGESIHQGRRIPVALPDDLLRRHLLLVAKTRRGKSSLMLRLFQYLTTMRASDGRPGALVLVDPHRDLAHAALGLVPAHRRPSVVILDVADRERPFGLNLIDAGLGWDRDKAISNTLAIFRHQFDTFWGPRMEDAFRFALLTLFDANQGLCAAGPEGRLRQHTILTVPNLLVNPAFRRGVVAQISDPHVKAWWREYYDPLDRRLQLEIANPVQTKVQRFVGSRAARNIVGQPRSTIDPTTWLQDGAIIIIHAAKGMVGEDTAALVGATLLNIVALVVGEQVTLPPSQRRPVSVLVDEMHTIPGADYEAFLAELAKYGAALTLATQSLTRLNVLDKEQHRALPATLFANIDGLFAFQVSAEDARYLARELGGEADEADLLNLKDFQCYARLSVDGERLPPFSVDLDPPPSSDERVAEDLATQSANTFGRHWTAVERDLQAALDRIAQYQRPFDPGDAGLGGVGVPRDRQPPSGGDSATATPPQKGRSDHREAKPPKMEQQPPLFNDEVTGDESREQTSSSGQPVEGAERESSKPSERDGGVQ